MLGGNPVFTIRNPQGRWARGPNDSCPPDHFIDEQNLMFRHGEVGSRTGVNSYLAASGNWNGTVKRIHVFKRVGEALRYLILDNSNNIWDSTSLTTPILTLSGMTDFSCVVLFNRAYISPSDGYEGMSGESVYVYDGTGTAREAAGVGVTSGTLAAADGATGKVEKGDHLFAVVCETASGFISPPGLTGTLYKKHTSAGNKQVNLSGIPLGPAGTVKRHIIATTLLSKAYNGNPSEQSWFFVPNGNIDDNVTTTKTVNFYDADLLTSADYLQYQKSAIPAGGRLSTFNGRLVVCGQKANNNIVLVSESGQPESISDRNGYIIVDPGDMGGAVTNALENRGLLYLFKSGRTYVTNDNGSSPATWNLNIIDSALGTECLGASQVLDTRGASLDQLLIANRSGLWAFPGAYSEQGDLTYKIRDYWRTINPVKFHMVQIHIDPIEQRIYVAAPIGAATEPDVVLVGDYKQGMTPEGIRWSKWVFPIKPTSIWTETDYTTKLGEFKFGSSEGSIYKLHASDRRDLSGANLINAYCRFGQVTFNDEGAVNHYVALRLRVRGYGQLDLVARSLDGAVSNTLPSIVLAAAGGVEPAVHINQESEELSIQVGTNSMYASNPSWFTLTHLRVAGQPRWSTRPM